MAAKLLIKMTLKQAKMLGIVRCKHCGYPPNNHFTHGKKVCAHAPCPGYEQSIVLPKEE